jgi:hypothetical protein
MVHAVDMARADFDLETTVDRQRAHLVLTNHAPGRDWRWLGLRLRCRYCGQAFPCPPRRSALDRLTDGLGPR